VTHPNVVPILCDAAGFGDLGCHGSKIRTTNLDRLASADPVCSPSRRNNTATYMITMLSLTKMQAKIGEMITTFPEPVQRAWADSKSRQADPSTPVGAWPRPAAPN